MTVLPIVDGGLLGPATDIIRHNGRGLDPKRQDAPHAHSVTPLPRADFVCVADLGLDRLMIYRLKAGRLLPADPPFVSLVPGSGPRHFTVHPNGRHAYLINELDSSMAVFSIDPNGGSLRAVQTVSTLPTSWKGRNTCADVHLHPNGNFLYGSNRGHDSIAVFAVDRTTGRLEPAGHVPTGGKNPRNFAVDPTGRYLLAANQDSDSIVVFRLEGGIPIRAVWTAEVPTPVCVNVRTESGGDSTEKPQDPENGPES